MRLSRSALSESVNTPTSEIRLTTTTLPSAQSQTGIPTIDYEGSQYRTEFWDGQGRQYEDAAERLALKQLIPPRGGRIAEVGAAFGRLASLYGGYEQIVLFDYSRTLLAEAVEQWGHDPRFVFVAGNIYELPLATGVLDTLVMVRVMHHLANVPSALGELERALHSQSSAVLEFANKRNLKSVLRWAARKQQWSPFDEEPLEFVELNFDFHPRWMAKRFSETGLQHERRLAVSHFRLPLLKERVSPQLLASADQMLFRVGGGYPLAPSVFVKASSKAERTPAATSFAPSAVHALFRCSLCGGEGMIRIDDTQVQCSSCEAKFAQKERIWDFKEPVKGSRSVDSSAA